MKKLIIKGSSLSEASRKIANETGFSRRTLYALIHEEYKEIN